MGTQHTVGTSVVDIWSIKKRKGNPNWSKGKRWLGRAQIKPGLARYRTKAWERENDAWTWAEEMVAKYRLGLESGARCTIRGLRDEYVEHLKRKGCSPRYVDQVNWVLGLVADAGINDMRDDRLASKLEQFFGSMLKATVDQRGLPRNKSAGPLSPRSRNAYMMHVKTLFSFARKRRYIPFDPIAGVVEQFKEPKTQKPIFSLDELREIVKDENRNQRFWMPMLLMLYTGMRLNEALNIQCQDVLWTEKRMIVRHRPNLYRLKGAKERYILLLDELAEVLRPLAKPFGFIVNDEEGRKYSHTWWSWHFRRLLRSCNNMPVNKRSPHSTRHTFCALSLACGRDSFEVRELLGHTSLNTTLRYSGAASLYREAVKDWPKGNFLLRTLPTANTNRSSTTNVG